MAYTTINFKSKKLVKEALASGARVTVFQPGPFGNNIPKDGTVYLEGPHYPQPHSWYGVGVMKDGFLVKVK